MTVETNLDDSRSKLTIKISGRFDFSVHQDFRKAVGKITANLKLIVIDFYNTSYMDSSALGMLLILRDAVNTHQQTIELININPEVKNILAIAHFDKLFSIA